MNVSLYLSPARTALLLLFLLAVIVTTDLVMQKIEYDRRGTIDYLVHWGFVAPDPEVQYPGWLFEELRFRFDQDQEYNIGSWFQGTLLLFIALLMLATSAAAKSAAARGVLQWRLLAVVFVFLSLDEIASLHELMGLRPEAPGARLSELLGLRRHVFFDWVLVAIPFVLAVSALALPLLLRLPRRTAMLLLLAAALYLCGALVVETLAGNYVNSVAFQPMRYRLLVAAEESLEGLGCIVAVLALLSYGNRLHGLPAERLLQAVTPLDLLAAAGIFFAAGVAFHIAAQTLLFDTPPRVAAPSEETPGIDQPQGWPPDLERPDQDGLPQEAPIVRTDCDAIRSSDYLSPEERSWFLANCL